MALSGGRMGKVKSSLARQALSHAPATNRSRLDAEKPLGEGAGMRRLLPAFGYGLILMVGWAGQANAQVSGSPPPAPAQLVMIFESEPSQFKGLTLNKVPFASLEVPMDAATIWPISPGKQELVVSAPGAEDRKLTLAPNPRQVVLLMLGLRPNPDSVKKKEHPKIISAEPLPLDLPLPDSKTRIFVYIPPAGRSLQASEFRDKKKPKPLELPAGKMTALEGGDLTVMAEGEPIVLAGTKNPGVYVFVVFPGPGGKLRSIPLQFAAEEPKKPGDPQDNRNSAPLPADF